MGIAGGNKLSNSTPPPATATTAPTTTSSFLSLHRPRIFQFSVVLHILLACGGFVPAISVYLQKGKWYVNPIKAPEEWSNENHPVMRPHAWISFGWILLSFLQYVVTSQMLLASRQRRNNNHPSFSSSLSSWARVLHRSTGYISTALLILFAINANHLTIQNGVTGLVLYNFLALITGTMMMWHLFYAITAIRRQKRDIQEHIYHVCGLLCLTCFPGIIRLVTVVPYQFYWYEADSCDVMNTSGLMLGSFPLNVLLLALLRWSATGTKFDFRDDMAFWVLMAADLLVGWLGDTLFQCHPTGQAMLAQTPGKSWVLENISYSSYAASS